MMPWGGWVTAVDAVALLLVIVGLLSAIGFLHPKTTDNSSLVALDWRPQSCPPLVVRPYFANQPASKDREPALRQPLEPVQAEGRHPQTVDPMVEGGPPASGQWLSVRPTTTTVRSQPAASVWASAWDNGADAGNLWVYTARAATP